MAHIFWLTYLIFFQCNHNNRITQLLDFGLLVLKHIIRSNGTMNELTGKNTSLLFEGKHTTEFMDTQRAQSGAAIILLKLLFRTLYVFYCIQSSKSVYFFHIYTYLRAYDFTLCVVMPRPGFSNLLEYLMNKLVRNVFWVATEEEKFWVTT